MVMALELDRKITLCIVEDVPRTGPNVHKAHGKFFVTRTTLEVEYWDMLRVESQDEEAHERIRKRLHARGYHGKRFKVQAAFGGFPANNAVIDEMSRARVAETGRRTGFPMIAGIEV